MARDGLTTATTRSIASEAKMNQAMLHYSFDGKEALLRAVLDTLHAEIKQFFVQSVQGAKSLHEAVAQLATAYWQQVQGAPELQRVQYELTLYALTTPSLRDLAQEQYQGYVVALSLALKNIPSRPGAAPLPVLAGLCVAMMDGLILQYLAKGDKAAAERRLAAGIVAMQSQCGARQ